MTVIAVILALAALALALIAFSRARHTGDRTDDNLRYLSDLRNRLGGDVKDLFREVNRLKVMQLKASKKMDYTPYEITDACIGCGACETECPEEAVRPGEIYRILPEVCSACGNCADVCPVEACIEMEVD
jgi:ferredoxin